MNIRNMVKDWRVLFVFFVFTVVTLVAAMTFNASAETRPGGADNGLTSRLLTLSNTLSGLGYGSTSNVPDWGQHWNRISTASQWVPSGSVTASDVKSGKTFYNGSRSQQTGTYATPGPCSTQAYTDSNGAPVTQTTNCTSGITWTTPSDGITGTDKQDSRTGLIWSQAIVNSSGTPTFTTSTPSGFTYINTGTNNVAVGTKTAPEICTAMGNGWRLPTQKEYMQAHIDGTFFNLTNGNTTYWTSTWAGGSNAVVAHVGNGLITSVISNAQHSIRCVR